MAYDAGLKVGVEGNAEFKRAVREINDELKTMDSALRLVESSYKGQMNSMEALKAKGEALQAIYDKQGEKVRELAAALQNAQTAESNYAGKVSEIKSKLAAAQAEMERLKNSTGDTASEQKRLADEMGDLNRALKAAEQGQSAAARSINYWQREVNDATVKLNNLESELKDNKRYMAEADKSTDKAATSIDRFGKETKEAAAATDDATQKGNLLTKIFAGGFLANIATQALNAVVGALKTLASAAMETAGNLVKLSAETGESIEKLQEMQYVTTSLDGDLQTLEKAQAKLTRSMDDARKGSVDYTNAFKALKVEYKNSDGTLRDATSVMYEAFDALGKIGSEADRDAVALKLFGRSAMELNPLIKAGSDELKRLSEEARNTGAVMSEDAVVALDTVGDNLDLLKLKAIAFVGEGLAAIIGAGKTAADEMGGLADSLGKTDDTLKLIDRYRTLQSELQLSGLSEAEATEKTKELNKAKQQLIDVSGGVVTALGLENGTFDEQVETLKEITSQQQELAKQQLIATATANIGEAAEDRRAKLLAESKKAYDEYIESLRKYNEVETGGGLVKFFDNIALIDTQLMSAGEKAAYFQDKTSELNKALEQSEADTAAAYQAIRTLVNDGYMTAEEAAAAFGLKVDELNAILSGTASAASGLSDAEQAIENLKTGLDELQTSYNEMYTSAREAIDGSIGLWEKMDTSVVKSAKEIQEALDSQIAWLSSYQSNLSALENRKIEGVDLTPLLENLSEVNKDSAAILAGLRNATDDEVREIVKSLNTLDYSKSNLAGTIADMKTEFVSEVDTLMQSAIDTMRQSDAAGDAANETMQGYIKQVYDMRDELVAAHRDVAKAANQAYKDELKIKSPSRVAMDATENYFEGHILKAMQMVPKMEAAYSEPARKAHLAMQSSIPSVVEQPARDNGAQTAAQIGGSISKALSGFAGSASGKTINLTVNLTGEIDGRQMMKATRAYRIEEDELAGPDLIER